MIVKALREGLGRVIVLISYITRPKKATRASTDQATVEQRVANMALYQFYACPFCVLVRREMHRLNLPIETLDAQNDSIHRQALLEGGGKIQAPCLMVEEGGEQIWLYESKAIIAYLKKSFDADADQELLKSS